MFCWILLCLSLFLASCDLISSEARGSCLWRLTLFFTIANQHYTFQTLHRHPNNKNAVCLYLTPFEQPWSPNDMPKRHQKSQIGWEWLIYLGFKSRTGWETIPSYIWMSSPRYLVRCQVQRKMVASHCEHGVGYALWCCWNAWNMLISKTILFQQEQVINSMPDKRTRTILLQHTRD